MRKIENVLHFRSDIFPFLVHLTRRIGRTSAREKLEKILISKELYASETLVSMASYGISYSQLDAETKRRFFNAICFTETPLNEIYCLLEISGRSVNLEPYGLVFLRERLEQRDVSPAFYINNELGNKADVIKGLCKLIEFDEKTAEQILPLISIFGKQLPPYSSNSEQSERFDFRWEREWRYPASKGDFAFTSEDILVGLCPDEEISHFEEFFPGIDFVDPTRNIKWYANKLIDARKRLDILHSVV
jgi:hypothetical protein